jgi:hypothetical protein
VGGASWAATVADSCMLPIVKVSGVKVAGVKWQAVSAVAARARVCAASLRIHDGGALAYLKRGATSRDEHAANASWAERGRDFCDRLIDFDSGPATRVPDACGGGCLALCASWLIRALPLCGRCAAMASRGEVGERCMPGQGGGRCILVHG